MSINSKYKKMKENGKVVVTALIIGMYSLSALGATGQALMSNVSTDDFSNSMTNTAQIQQVDQSENSFGPGAILSSIFGISAAHAANVNSVQFNQAALKKKIDKILVQGFFPKIEKKTTDNNVRISILKQIIKKVESLRDGKLMKVYKSNPQAKFIIDYLISKISSQVSKYQKAIGSNKIILDANSGGSSTINTTNPTPRYSSSGRGSTATVNESNPIINQPVINKQITDFNGNPKFAITASKAEAKTWNDNGGVKYKYYTTKNLSPQDNQENMRAFNDFTTRNPNYGKNAEANFKANPWSQEMAKQGVTRFHAREEIKMFDTAGFIYANYSGARVGKTNKIGYIDYMGGENNALLAEDIYQKQNHVFGDKINEAEISSVIQSGLSIPEIQEATQRYNNVNMVESLQPWVGGKATIISKTGKTQKVWIDNNIVRSPQELRVSDEVKYHFMINGELKIGSPKYESYKNDYMGGFKTMKYATDYYNKFGKNPVDNIIPNTKGDYDLAYAHSYVPSRGIQKGYAVKLQQNPALSQATRNKIRSNYKFSATEMKDIWTKVIKAEGLQDIFWVVFNTNGDLIVGSNYSYSDNNGQDPQFTIKANEKKSLNPEGWSYITKFDNLVQYFFYRG